jgi:1-acyl-sn-glycerol-3-phosphate acyltransferase
MGWSALGRLWKERPNRFDANGNTHAKTLLGQKRPLSLGVSLEHYRFFCGHQLRRTCLSKWTLSYHGLQHIPVDEPVLFVMKHRGFTDITLHGFGYAWATSGVTTNINSETDRPWLHQETFHHILQSGQPCRFVMKEDLLTLPIGAHLVINGGIPVPQDLETKAKNTPGFDPEAPEVLAHQESMSSWFSFKDSYREIVSTLKNKGAVMIYGEATRVDGNQMGHLSLNMIERLSRSKGTHIIPVGTRLLNGGMEVHYGPACEAGQLRDHIAELSGISKDNYL